MAPKQERLLIETRPAQDRNETASAEHWARRMCESGNYHEIITLLRSNPFVFESQKERIFQNHEKSLVKAEFLGPKDWEMLSVLELYDPKTFEHALRVFESIHEKLTSRREIGLFLRGKLRQEDVRSEDLLRAALHHDVGKIAIPKEILNDTTSDEEWQIYAKLALDPDSFDHIRQRFERNPKLRAKDVVPFSCAVSTHLSETLRDRGIDPDLPLGIIVGKHADISGDILRSYGFPVAAEIAESHHNRPIHQERRPVSISSFRASWILRTADIFDAIRNARAYKNERPVDTALAILEEEASAGFIDPKLANLWMNDEFRSGSTC